jgi:hypothetical protein
MLTRTTSTPSSRHRTLPVAGFAAGLLAVIFFSGCSTVYTKRIHFDGHPIAARVKSEAIDDELLRYSVVFRNTGCQSISFDYTIGDEPGVVHIDSDGPNSGSVENLYPGAEVEVENPVQRIAVWITIGKVVHGKRPSREITEVFRPGAALAGGDEELLDDGGLPTL